MESAVPGAPIEAPERRLAFAAASGDVQAFEALIAPRLDGLYRTALAIVRNEADARDAVQDACVRSWRELRRLRDVDRFDAWLGRILINTCRDMLRSRRRTVVREISVTVGHDRPAASEGTAFADRLAEVDSLRRAVQRLKADHRVLLALHHGEDRSVAEIAALLGQPAGTVKWRLHEARKALARALERER